MSQSAEQPDPAAALARFAQDFDLDDVPAFLVERAKLSILDSLGIGLASTTYGFAQITADAIAAIAGDGRYPVIGMPITLPLRDAAHLNGTLIHGLDFDDTHTESVVHTSASAVPTMLMAGLATNADGRRALSAFVIASETASRIGAAARGGFHNQGYHPTGVVGTFGATLAAGYLNGLSVDQLIKAQGVALSKAAGSLQFLDDGAWTKRNHPGWAAAAALTAVSLAAHGFEGPRDPYFGRYGLYPLHTPKDCEINHNKLVRGLGSEWEMARIAFKPYPACHLMHAFADAALAIKRSQKLDVSTIEKITVYVHQDEIPVICEPVALKAKPQTAYDAQFSVNYIVAATLIRDKFGLAELNDAVLCDPNILELCTRVHYLPDPDSAYPDFYSGAIDIHTRDGKTHHWREQKNRGSAENPMTDADVRNKFLDNATLAVERPAAEAIMDLVMQLDSQPTLEPLTSLLRKT